MGLLRLLSKSAIICNGCLLLALLALHYRKPISQELFSYLIITGLFLSLILNTVVLAWWLLLRLNKRGTVSGISPLFIGIHAAFLLVQLIMLYK